MANGIRKRDLIRDIGKYAEAFSPVHIQSAWDASPAKAMQLILLDTAYMAVDLKTWKKILQYSSINQAQYIADVRDCDDFSFALRGSLPIKLGFNGIGCVVDWSSAHAYSALLVVDSNKKLKMAFVEPQSDRMVVADTPMYETDSGFAIF